MIGPVGWSPEPLVAVLLAARPCHRHERREGPPMIVRQPLTCYRGVPRSQPQGSHPTNSRERQIGAGLDGRPVNLYNL